MIKERYCSFEVSKLLREKGFDEPCRAVYEEKILRNTLCDYLNSQLSSYACAPTHQMAIDWIGEKHNILIWFSPVIPESISKDDTVFYWEWKAKKKRHSYPHVNNHIKYETYEEAVEAALEFCLTKLI